MSQNRPEADRIRVAAGLAASDKPQDREVAPLIRFKPDIAITRRIIPAAEIVMFGSMNGDITPMLRHP